MYWTLLDRKYSSYDTLVVFFFVLLRWSRTPMLLFCRVKSVPDEKKENAFMRLLNVAVEFALGI